MVLTDLSTLVSDASFRNRRIASVRCSFRVTATKIFRQEIILAETNEVTFTS